MSLEARPACRGLLQDAKNGIIDLLLIYRLDRLGRSARIPLTS
ncbi:MULTISPECIES: recombinase family protein [Brevibacillus]